MMATRGPFPVGLAITALLIALGLFSFLHSPYFHITDIAVHGNEIVDEASLLAKAQVQPGDNLLNVDMRALAGRVATHPRVRHVNVDRRLPSTLLLVVSEHVPVALVVQEDAEFALTGEGGVVPVGEAEKERLPIIAGLDPKLLPLAVEAAARMPAALRLRVAAVEVDARDGVSITLRTRSDGLILLGDEHELARKAAIAESLLQTDDYALIDVRFPRSPAVRAR